MEKTVNKNISGVSLIEIMISLVLVAIALIAITSVFPSINKNRKGIQEAEQAKIIATQVLDGLQYLTIDGKCDEFPVGEEKDDCEAFVNRYQGQGKEVVVGIVKYTVNWSDTDKSSGMTIVVVTVSWTKGGKPHNVKVTGAL